MLNREHQSLCFVFCVLGPEIEKVRTAANNLLSFWVYFPIDNRANTVESPASVKLSKNLQQIFFMQQSYLLSTCFVHLICADC